MTEDRLRIETSAGFGLRLAAFAADYLVIYVANALTSSFFRWGFSELVLILAYFWLLTGLYGQTLGKRLLRIEVQAGTQHVNLGRAFVREVVGKLVASAVIFIGLLWIAFDPQKRGWHDFIAGTRAVRVEYIDWSADWEAKLTRLLWERSEVRGEVLTTVPPSWRAAVLEEYARRHRDLTVLDGEVLRPVATVEEF